MAQHVAVEQAGLVDRGGCDRAAFVGSHGADRAQVFATLSALRRWRARPGSVKVTCSLDQPLVAICASPAQTRAALMRAVLWRVPAPMTLWVTLDGRPGYTIAFDAMPARTISMTYPVPAPF